MEDLEGEVQERSEPIELTQLVGRILHITFYGTKKNVLDFLVSEFKFKLIHPFDKNQFPREFADYEGKIGDKNIIVTHSIYYGDKVSKRITIKEKGNPKLLFEYNL